MSTLAARTRIDMFTFTVICNSHTETCIHTVCNTIKEFKVTCSSLATSRPASIPETLSQKSKNKNSILKTEFTGLQHEFSAQSLYFIFCGGHMKTLPRMPSIYQPQSGNSDPRNPHL